MVGMFASLSHSAEEEEYDFLLPAKLPVSCGSLEISRSRHL